MSRQLDIQWSSSVPSQYSTAEIELESLQNYLVFCVIDRDVKPQLNSTQSTRSLAGRLRGLNAFRPSRLGIFRRRSAPFGLARDFIDD